MNGLSYILSLSQTKQVLHDDPHFGMSLSIMNFKNVYGIQMVTSKWLYIYQDLNSRYTISDT